VHEGPGQDLRAEPGGLQRGPLGQYRRARSAGPPGRADPPAVPAPGHRRRPGRPDRDRARAVSLATHLTWLLPHRALSALARQLAYSRNPAIKQRFIDAVVRRFNVDMSEAAEPDAAACPSFNAFFTRALKPGARVPDADPRALLMPADGRISQLGTIGEDGRIFQAKGQSFTAAELLGDEEAARVFAGGSFATVYLSPRDYHRVHMPWTGTLRATVHGPGRLFSVGPGAVRAVPRLFARNERLVCHFDTGFGPMASVMVGAMLVSGVETVWSGVEIPE